MFSRPASLVVKGPSAAGKSYETEQVLEFFPDRAYYFLTSSSDKALAYLNEPMANRMLVIAEAVGLQSETFDYMLRSLLSEGRIKHVTVERNPESGRFESREIVLEGPTGLLITTTAISLHKENETRLISIPVDDSQEQTRRVLGSIAAKASEGASFGPNIPADMQAWHAFQAWIQLGPSSVVIPFAMKLVAKIPALAVRLRRDVAALMTLISSHALLHQASREHDEQGRVVATLEDYEVVRELVAPLIAEGIDATVSATVRETVGAVAEALKEGPDKAYIPTSTVATALSIDRSAAYRRVQAALAKGYLRNEETRKGRPAKLRLGDALPADQEILPSLQALTDGGCAGAGDSEGSAPPLPPSEPETPTEIEFDLGIPG